MTEKGVEFETVHYIDQPPSAKSLQKLLRLAGLKPQDAVRKNEPAYREYVAGRNLSDNELIELMATHPELIQRPIVVSGEKAVLARPVQKLDELPLK